MLFVYLLAILAGLILLRYLYLVGKRLSLIRRLGRLSSHPIRFARGRLASVFSVNGRTDLILRIGREEHHVAVITTPYTRVRYHFTQTQLEIYYERQRSFFFNTRVGRSINGYSTTRVLRRYTLTPPTETARDVVQVFLLHPAPRLASYLVGTRTLPLDNGDRLTGDIIACGARYYIAHADELSSLSRRTDPDSYQ